MPIEEKALSHWINHFYGYGSWRARAWLVAHEESGGDLPEEVAEKFDFFYKTPRTQPTLCDIRESYRHFSMHWEGSKTALFNTLYEYRFGERAQLSGVWKNLTAFAHGFKSQELPDPLAYQKNLLAQPNEQREALIKLFPLPSPHNHAWYYSWLDVPQLPFLKSRTLYQEHLYATRMQTILTKMAEYKPDVVLMYGMENINALKKTVHQFFSDVKFRTCKAVKMQTPQHHRADVRGTILLITTQIPALRHNRKETGFDWLEFGRSVGADAKG